VKRRAGLPQDVAALVEQMGPDSVTLTLVNVSQIEPRTVVVQAGAYAEHQFQAVTRQASTVTIDSPHVTVKLAPGAGERLQLRMKRYANAPTLIRPWDRGMTHP
jgi:hypothetical protein